MIFIVAVWAVLATFLAVIFYIHSKKVFHTIDEMTDAVLSNRAIIQSDLTESDISVLADRMIRIKDKLDFEVSRAELEKEQVKRLISNMSHQLKTPLANVMMYQELLENDNLTSEERSAFLRKMKLQSEKIDWILQSLFKMMKLEQDFIQINAEGNSIKETVLQAVSSVFQKAEKKNIEISMDETPDYMLYHDRKWTCEVFENIFENAIKYTKSGGKIFISIEPLEMYAVINIRDNGRGIRKEELIRIFERFYRSSDVENIEGSGIGLYLSKMILEKEKGYINVTSEYGEGSCFSVYLQKV